MRATLGPLWGHFGISLGSVWVSVDDFASLDGHFAIIVESLWVYKGPFPKTLIFPTDYNDFIKPLGDFFPFKSRQNSDLLGTTSMK